MSDSVAPIPIPRVSVTFEVCCFRGLGHTENYDNLTFAYLVVYCLILAVCALSNPAIIGSADILGSHWSHKRTLRFIRCHSKPYRSYSLPRQYLTVSWVS